MDNSTSIRISVAMTTYNGERYVAEQLASFLEQTLPPDQVIILDDCSTDNTAKIVLKFIQENNLRNWEFYVNDRNIGWMKNFIKAIDMTDGDVILLSDQDDYWLPSHVEILTKILRSNQNANLVTSRPLFCKERLNPPNGLAVEPIRKRIPMFNQRYLLIERPGCTYCFRKSFYHTVREFWDPEIPHDAFLYTIAKFTNSLILLDISTILFRRHDSNASSLKRKNRTNLFNELNYSEKLSDALLGYSQKHPVSKDNISIVQHEREFLKRRRIAIEKRSILRWLALSIELHCFTSVKNYCCDLWCILFKKASIPRFNRN